ncbi:MAG TPA: carbon-nitrogen hydrolase family protein, partial [Candidatus Saccharimonadales bacterium]|nr:carbon-nitrogen hydrolase family protein [Candidatus Saccharimonadales bacterium]
MFQLAIIQMLVEGGCPAQNLARATRMVEQAAEKGAEVVLLPEALDVGWTHPSAGTLAEAIPDGSTFKFLQDLARRHQVYLCSGITERCGELVFNAAVLISPDGELLLHHRKLN